jgi:hypothetical protein
METHQGHQGIKSIGGQGVGEMKLPNRVEGPWWQQGQNTIAEKYKE